MYKSSQQKKKSTKRRVYCFSPANRGLYRRRAQQINFFEARLVVLLALPDLLVEVVLINIIIR